MYIVARASEGLSTGGAEGILYRVMKLKNPIVSKGIGSLEIYSPRKIFSFSLPEIAFWAILHQTGVVITCLVPYAAGNYKLRVLMHAGMKQNTFSYIISR